MSRYYKFKNIVLMKANVWLVILATLIGLLVAAWIAQLQGKALLSFASGQARVVLVDGSGKAYPDSITAAAGSTIRLGWMSYWTKNCQSDGWTQVTGRSLKAVEVGPVTQDQTFTVTCTTSRGQVTDSVFVTVGNTGVITVTSPKKGEVWEPGQRYAISWALTATSVDDVHATNCVSDAVCPPGAVSSDSDNRLSGQPKVTISLHGSLPACVRENPPCAVKQVAPYIIYDDILATNTYAWTVPADLPAAYRGSRHITVTIGAHSGDSAVFTIGSPPRGVDNTIMVLSPNGGEIWDKATKNHTITWKVTGTLSKLNIQLIEEVCTEVACLARQPRVYPVATGVDPLAGTYTFSKISTIGNGRYRVRVTTSDELISDDSDAPFTIQDKVPSPGNDGGQVPLGQEFSVNLGQTVTVASQPPLTLKFLAFNAVACTQSIPPSCFGSVKLEANGTTYTFKSSGGDTQVIGGVKIQLVGTASDGSSVRLIANQ